MGEDSKWKKGDRVYATMGIGGYAQYAVCGDNDIFSLPQNLSFEQGIFYFIILLFYYLIYFILFLFIYLFYFYFYLFILFYFIFLFYFIIYFFILFYFIILFFYFFN